MTAEQLNKLSDFIVGYEKLCQETGIHLEGLDSTGTSFRPSFLTGTNTVKVSYIPEGDTLVTEIVPQKVGR